MNEKIRMISYSLIRNFILNMKVMYEWDKKMLLFQFLQIVSSIIMTYIGIRIPVEIVACIEENNNDLILFIMKLLVYLGVYYVCNIISLDVFQYIYRNGGTLAISYCSKIYEKIMFLSYESLEKRDIQNLIGSVWHVLKNDYLIRNYVVVIPKLITAILGILWYGSIIARNNFALFLIDVCVCAFGFIMLNNIKKKQEKYYDGIDLISKIIAYINKISMEPSAGKDIRIFQMSGLLKRKFKEALENSNKIFSKIEGMYLKEGLFSEFILVMLNIGSYIIFGIRAINGEISVAEFMFLVTVITQLSGYLNEFLEYSYNLIRANISIDYIRRFLEIEEFGQNEKITISKNELSKKCVIEFKNVTYKYPGSEQAVLENINLKIESNQKIALIGMNGAGKTTLIKLLCGLYKPSEGAIYLNGQDICSIKNITEVIAALFQDSDILPLTTDENIVGIRTKETNEEEIYRELMRVVREADFENTYNKLKNRGKTMLVKRVNHDASDLSGGEKQKLLFSRTLYQKAKILILDEPTSALDPIAEQKLYNDFSKITKDTTTIFVSHRLSSTAFCDDIILLNNGKIVEKGTHDELIKKNGLYAELYALQKEYYREEVV